MYLLQRRWLFGWILSGVVSQLSVSVSASAVHIDPAVELLSPADRSLFPVGANILVSADAEPTEGIIVLVEFFADDLKLGEVRERTNSNYQLTWNNAPEGSYGVYAIATDDFGARGFSPISHITVSSSRTNQPPLVAITSPVDGAFVRGPGSVLITVRAQDNDGAVTHIEFLENERKIGEITDRPYRFLWQNVPLGIHSVTALATDILGTKSSSVVSFTVSVIPAQIIRGPYLQMTCPTGINVNWRTDVPIGSRVCYGTNSATLNQIADDSAEVTDHSLRLSGLTPDTRYFYSINSGQAVLAVTPDQSFITPPAATRPMRIWVLGDSGTANFEAQAVRDAYYGFNTGRYTDIWLMLGDNAYGTGSDEEYQGAVFNMFPQTLRQTTLWPTRGNHDFDGAYLDIFTLPTAGECGGVPSGTESYYSFDYANAHFICLNAFNEDRSSNGPMLAWLREDLAQTPKEWIIAFWHHPPYSRGSHDSDTEIELIEMRENAVPILEEYGADLVLCGHSHAYERSFFLQGHYGGSVSFSPEMKINPGSGRTNAGGAYIKYSRDATAQLGTVYVVAGSSGQQGGGRLNHPAMFISLDQLGCMVLDIDGPRLESKFLQASGDVTDYFTIEKRAVTLPALEITRIDLDELIVSWNSTDLPVVLEITGALGPNPEWQPVTSTRITSGNQTGVHVEIDSRQQFFRLRATH